MFYGNGLVLVPGTILQHSPSCISRLNGELDTPDRRRVLLSSAVDLRHGERVGDEIIRHPRLHDVRFVLLLLQFQSFVV